MGFADPDSEGDRLQQLRAVLPCDLTLIKLVRTTAVDFGEGFGEVVG
jgi:hypothetical protein